MRTWVEQVHPSSVIVKCCLVLCYLLCFSDPMFYNPLKGVALCKLEYSIPSNEKYSWNETMLI